MDEPAPRVSVIIPTFSRPALLRVACLCALRQTMADLEVIVVIDGDDAQADTDTRSTLATLDDSRLRVIATGGQLGNGAARNLGIDAARGRWIALLDDDDEWMADKLAIQLAEARDDEPATLISCRLEARLSAGKMYVWPRRRPRAGEALGEYLFCPRRPGTGEGMAQTSTWLAPAALMRKVRFDAALRRYVDLDWLLRAAEEVDGFRIHFAGWPRPLSVWSIQPDRQRISTIDDGVAALKFADDRRALLTRRAYAGFVLSLASAAAAGAKRRPGFAKLLSSAMRYGRPTAAGMLGHALNFYAPRQLLHHAAGMAERIGNRRMESTRQAPH